MRRLEYCLLIIAILVCGALLFVPCGEGDAFMTGGSQVQPAVAGPPPTPDSLAAAPKGLIPYPPAATRNVALLTVLIWLHLALVGKIVADATPLGGFLHRHPVARTVLLCGAGVLACVHLEVSTRHYVQAHRIPYRPDAVMLWTPTYAEPGLDNRFGLRCRDVAPGRQPGTVRILIHGDSATWGTGVPLASNYASLLEARLNREDGAHHHYEVINAAIKGSTSVLGLPFAERLVRFYQPDVILVGYNNDSQPSDLEDMQRVAPAPARAVQSWLYRSEAYLLLRREVFNFFLLARGTGPAGAPVGRPRVSLADYRACLDRFADLAQNRGARLALLIMPTSHRSGYDEAVRDVGRRRGAAVIDLNVIWQGNTRLRRLLVPNIFHPTPYGHRLIADVIYRQLRADGRNSTR